MKTILLILGVLLLSVHSIGQRPIVNHANTQLGELMPLNDSTLLVKNTPPTTKLAAIASMHRVILQFTILRITFWVH